MGKILDLRDDLRSRYARARAAADDNDGDPADAITSVADLKAAIQACLNGGCMGDSGCCGAGDCAGVDGCEDCQDIVEAAAQLKAMDLVPDAIKQCAQGACGYGGSMMATGNMNTGTMSNPGMERAFVLHANSGRTVITAPLREVASKNDGFLYLHGRFVEADTPNRNGALWTTEDLQMGEGSVAGGPLNWLHQETKIIGTLLNGHLIDAREAAAEGVGNHIQSTAAVWRFLFPQEADTIERAAANNGAYYSMECISKQVACVDSPGHPGCGEVFSYSDFDAKRACSHLNERSSVRRFIEPLFLGGAIIVPPVQPGWAKAEVDIVRQAAALSEREGLATDLSRKEAAALATAILTWANR